MSEITFDYFWFIFGVCVIFLIQMYIFHNAAQSKVIFLFQHFFEVIAINVITANCDIICKRNNLNIYTQWVGRY